MMDMGTSNSDPNAPILPRWAIIGGVALLALTAAAAPFYGQVVGGLLWAGQTLKAICGW